MLAGWLAEKCTAAAVCWARPFLVVLLECQFWWRAVQTCECLCLCLCLSLYFCHQLEVSLFFATGWRRCRWRMEKWRVERWRMERRLSMISLRCLRNPNLAQPDASKESAFRLAWPSPRFPVSHAPRDSASISPLPRSLRAAANYMPGWSKIQDGGYGDRHPRPCHPTINSRLRHQPTSPPDHDSPPPTATAGCVAWIMDRMD